MFEISSLNRRSKPERLTEQAWEQLTATINSAGDSVRHTAGKSVRSARHATSQLAEEAADRVGAVTDEAWQRASRAYDALAGRRPGLPWLLLIGAGLIGAVVGWATGTAARIGIARAEQAASRVEFVDIDPPNPPDSLAN